ncbi:hypothetical protein IRJ41_004894 [Triplophysa rosa]|uniref:SCAN box domain-containing protein n=1 Tax=Triplophysa rosa TaxID=992332 RepID=A0A9W7WHT8_TRIRA|nr:hypothetical protein IRJ41_004894 [Triplophysa rosa]
MEEIVRRLAEITVRQQQLTEQLTQRQNRADAAMDQMREAIAAWIPLPELTDQDDVEAYLHTFEVIAAREAWDKAEWVKILAPFLTGEAQRAYYALPTVAAEDYDVLKAEILARMGLSAISAAHLFFKWTYDENTPVRAQAAQLSRLGHLWLLSDRPTASQVAERVVVDRLLRALPRRYRTAVSMRGPTILMDLIESVELAEASAARDAGERAMLAPRRVSPAWRPPEGISRPGNRPAAPSPLDEPMPTEPGPVAPRAWMAGCAVHRQVSPGAPQRVIKVNGRPVTATLDSGSTITLVQPDVVAPGAGGKFTIPITCVHGDTREFPARRVTVAAPLGSWPLDVGIVDDLPVPVLLGRDWPGFDQLLATSLRPTGRGGRPRRHHPRRTPTPYQAWMAAGSEPEGEDSTRH